MSDNNELQHFNIGPLRITMRPSRVNGKRAALVGIECDPDQRHTLLMSIDDWNELSNLNHLIEVALRRLDDSAFAEIADRIASTNRLRKSAKSTKSR